jgi:hypothetical protein
MKIPYRAVSMLNRPLFSQLENAKRDWELSLETAPKKPLFLSLSHPGKLFTHNLNKQPTNRTHTRNQTNNYHIVTVGSDVIQSSDDARTRTRGIHKDILDICVDRITGVRLKLQIAKLKPDPAKDQQDYNLLHFQWFLLKTCRKSACFASTIVSPAFFSNFFIVEIRFSEISNAKIFLSKK